MRSPDIIVTGTGRSGTSFIAYVLHMKMNVCMGHLMDRRPSRYHRWGAYEDSEMKPLHRHLLSVRCSTEDWLEKFNTIHRRCGGLIGVKHPDTAFFSIEDWEAIAPRVVVWAQRRLSAVAESKKRVNNPFGPWRSEKAWRCLERLGEAGVVEMVKVDMNEERSVEWMVEKLGPSATAGSAETEIE